MPYREIIAVCSEIRTKHINVCCRPNVECLNVNLVVLKVTLGYKRLVYFLVHNYRLLYIPG